MDSVTQFVLGASVAHAMVGKKLGKKALLIGGALGTIPDLDVFVNFGDAIDNFTMHRGFSHSFLVLSILSFVLQLVVSKFALAGLGTNRKWFYCALACFFTHILLDALTVYGTQLYWPIPGPPVSVSSVFIIDPLYTIWLLLGCGIVAFHRKSSHSSKVSFLALMVSSAYLVFSLGAKYHVESQLRQSFEAKGVKIDRLVSTASPFNTLVWRGLVKSQGDFYEMYYSIPTNRAYPIRKIASEPKLAAQISKSKYFQRLDWFTHGFVMVDVLDTNEVIYENPEVARAEHPQRVILRDLRMGSHPSYFFSFDIGSITEQGEFVEAKESLRLAVSRDLDAASDLLKATLLGRDLP